MGWRTGTVLTVCALVLAGSPAAGHAQGKGGGGGKAHAGAPPGGGGGKAQSVARPQQGGGQGKAQAGARPQAGGGSVQAAKPSQGRGNAARGGGGQQRGGAVAQGRGQGNSAAGRGGAVAKGRGGAVAGGRGGVASGGGRGNGNAGRNGPAATASRGNAGNAGSARGVAGGTSHSPSWSRARQELTRLPEPFQALGRSSRRSDHFVLGATALAAVHGLNPDALDVRHSADRVEVRNRRGQVLFDLGEDEARNLGGWDLRLLGDRTPSEDAPAFCRSGAGHPVWGREWCLDRGYGLGRTNGRLWSRTTSVSDIIFRSPSTLYTYRYERPSLLELLGGIVLNRLALHALSLGFDQPLAGRWVAEPQAPRLLLIDAGPQPVAELVDLDGDNRVDVLYVTETGW